MAKDKEIKGLALIVAQYLANYTPADDHTEIGVIIRSTEEIITDLADMADFAEMNEVYASFFEGVCPARSAVAVKTLPKEARVEIECIAVR